MEVNKKDITPFEKELEKEIINGIIEYLKYGKEPKALQKEDNIEEENYQE